MQLDPSLGGRHLSPAEALLRAVIGRAVLDLFTWMSAQGNDDEATQARREALNFLTDETGAWARSRRDLCEAVGMDHDRLRRRIVAVLDGEFDPPAVDGRNELKGLAKARALWEQEKIDAVAMQERRLADAAQRAVARGRREAAHRAREAAREAQRPITTEEIAALAHRDVLTVLSPIEGRTAREIAKALGLTYNAAKLRIDRARERGLVEKVGEYRYRLARAA